MVVDSNYNWVDEFLPRVLPGQLPVAFFVLVYTTVALFVWIRNLILALRLDAPDLVLVDVKAGCLHLKTLEHCVGTIDCRLALWIVLRDLLMDRVVELLPTLAEHDLKLTCCRVNHLAT